MRIIVRAGDVSVRRILCDFAEAVQARFLRNVDEINLSPVFSDRIDFDLRRARGHYHRASFAKERAGISDRVPEIARGSSNDVRVLYLGGHVVRSAKLEAAGVLERLAGENDIDSKLSRQTRGVNDRCRTRRGCAHRGRGGRGECAHGNPRGLRFLKKRRTSAIIRKRIPAQRIAASSVRIPHASKTAATNINASLAMVNGLIVYPFCDG